MLTRIHCTTRLNIEGKVGYKLTSFGETLKPFVSRLIELFVKYKVSPREIFGHMRQIESYKRIIKFVEDIPVSGKEREILEIIKEYKEISLEELSQKLKMSKSYCIAYLCKLENKKAIKIEKIPIKTRGSINTYDVLKLLYEKKRLSLSEIADKLNITENTISSILKRLENQGIVKSYFTQIYKLKREPTDEEIKEIGYKKEHIRYVIDITKKKDYITFDDLKSLPLSESSKRNLISILVRYNILSPATGLKFKRIYKYYELTEKGRKFVKELIDLVENAVNRKLPKILIKPSSEELIEFLYSYKEWRKRRGRTRGIILQTIYEYPGLLPSDISNITEINIGTVKKCLNRLSKKGAVIRENYRYYPSKAYYKVYEKVLENPGIAKDKFNKEEKACLDYLIHVGSIVEVDNRLYIRKGIRARERTKEGDKTKDLCTYR